MSRAEPPLLELRDVSISYFLRSGEVPAVTGVSLTVRAGEAVGLVGESGCGKSTLAMAILGYLGGTGRIVGGEIHFAGENVAALHREGLRRLRGGGIGIVYQEAMSALNPSLRIGEQLAEVLIYHHGLDWRDARREAIGMLGQVGLSDPERLMHAYPHELSGGQQQRVVIAMALLPRPRLLVLDEPTTNLDVTIEAGIVDLIRALGETLDTALLFISHNLGLLAQVCDRVAVMYAGEVVEECAVDQIFAGARHPYTRGLIRCIPQPHLDPVSHPLRAIQGQVSLPHGRPTGCRFAPRCEHVVAGRCDCARVALAETTDPGHRVRCVRWAELAATPAVPASRTPPRRDNGIALGVTELEKSYPATRPGFGALLGFRRGQEIIANHKLSFRVRRGQTVAIVGESGCGKSTFAKILMGLEQASGGEIHFGAVELAHLPVERRPQWLLRALQMVFQNPDETLNPSHRVGTQIARAVRCLGVERNSARVAARVRQLLALMKLPATVVDRWPRQLSGGQKQRVGIARAFAGSPALVVADEPVSALDVSVQAAITELLLEIQRDHGTTLIVITHDLGVVRYIADRVVVMYLGEVMETGSVGELFAPPYHPYTEALLSAAPIADPRVRRQRILLSGDFPSRVDPPRGCPFHTRCHRKIGSICESEVPPIQRAAAGHRIHCHIPLEQLRRVAPVFAGPAAAQSEVPP